MSRYLTPSKVGLLALIELYVEGAVPNEAIVPVVNFVASHLFDCDPNAANTANNPAGRWAMAQNTMRVISSLQDFEQVLGPLAAVDRLPGRRLWDRFLEKLWGIDSLHAIQEFFDNLPQRLARTKEELRRLAENGKEPPSGVLLSRNSPFGAFIRKACLEFSRLPFHTAADLWKAFVKYRQPTADSWRRRNPHYGRLSFDAVLMTGQHEWGEGTDDLAVVAYGNMLLGNERDDTTPVSASDIEDLLEIQIGNMHKFGDRVPPEVREQFQSLLKQSHTVPSLSHYLSFCEASRMGDFPTSFDYLHRYFDYSMQSRDRPFYQYALMNLAILQTEFGCHKEAVATMLEAVSTARENRDNQCLNFALNWLYQFGRAHPKLVRDLESSSVLGSGKETLSFLRVKAKEAGMWMLWSAALMSEARLGMGNGESVSTAIEHMVRSSQLIIERNLKPNMGGQLAVVTALWDRLGLSYLSGMTDEVFLRCHARNCIFDEQLKATCRLAGLLVGRGMYDEAFTKLESMESNPLRSFKPNQYWQLYRGLLKLRRDLHHQNLEAADHLLSQLIQFGHDSLEPGITHITDELHIEMHIRRGDFTAASTKIDRLLAGLQEDDRDISLRIRLLLDKAHLFDRIGRPAKGFTISMRAASMAWRARLMPLLWQAVGALSNILNSLGEFAAASQLLVAVLPRCLETDNLFAVATLYSLLADAWTGQAGEAQPPSTTSLQSPSQTQTHTQTPSLAKRTEFLTKAHEALDSASNYFSAVEDVEKQCEMLAKKATLMRAMGDYVRSEDYAARYVALKRESMARNS